MKLNFAILLFLGALLLTPAAHAGLILDLQTGNPPEPCLGCDPGLTFGWLFSLSTPFTIDGLGMWEPNGSSLSATSVGLWSSDGTLLARRDAVSHSSTLVPSSSADGAWRVESISPLLLGPGTYAVGAVFRSGTLATVNPTYTHPNGVFVIGGASNESSTGLAFPTRIPYGVIGATLRTLDASAVPEPSSMALAISGLAALVASRRRRARR
jgi:hypothetical protein